MDGHWWGVFALGTLFGVIWSVSAAVIYVLVVEYRRKWRYKRGLIDSILAYERTSRWKRPQR